MNPNRTLVGGSFVLLSSEIENELRFLTQFIIHQQTKRNSEKFEYSLFSLLKKKIESCYSRVNSAEFIYSIFITCIPERNPFAAMRDSENALHIFFHMIYFDC